MNKDEALKLAYDETWSAGSEYPIPSFDDVMSFANKLEAIKEALAQQALDKKAENARELGLDYEPKQEPCGGCGGSGWVTRDPDIGTDQECFVCEGAGVIKPEQEPCCYGGIAHDCHAGKGCRIVKRMKVTQKPPQRKPLSEEEIGAILEDVNAYGTRLYTFARAIEAAHGIKD